MMATVTVSPKYQVVIPKDVREALRLKPGQKLAVTSWGTGISLIPEQSLEEVQAMFAGVDDRFERDKADRSLD